MVYSVDEVKRYGELLECFEDTKMIRSQSREEFDDRTYEQDYYANRRAMNSYLKKKKNDDEVRIVTGISEKKMEVVINELLTMQLTHEVRAFDTDDNEINELGRDFGDIVTRTNEIEQEEDKEIGILVELLGQRALFIEEFLNIKTVTEKKRISEEQWLWGEQNSSFEKKKIVIKRCEKRLIPGIQLFLGDITLPAYRFQEQPYIFKYERMHYKTAEGIYGTWDKWKYVKPGSGNSQWMAGVFGYRLFDRLPDDEVEIIKYQSYPDDEYQIFINGVMMFSLETPLPWEKEGYNIEMIITKPMHEEFAYGRCLMASAKVLQALADENIRLLIRKFRQALEPPIGVKSVAGANAKVYTRDIWTEGAVTQGITDKNFTRLIDHQGVTQSELNMYQLIENKVQEFIGATDIDQGIKQQGANPTATEVIERRKQALKMLGISVYAWIKVKRETTFLRIQNILENYTLPVGKTTDVGGNIIDKYNNFTVSDVMLDDGRMGKKIIKFTDRMLTDEEREQVYNEEKRQEDKGKNVQFKFINTKLLRSIRLFWWVSVTSKPKDNSDLDRAMFNESVVGAFNISKITGIPLNGEKLTTEYERVWNKKDLFQKQAPGAITGVNQSAGEQAQELLKQTGDIEKSKPEAQAMKKGAKMPAMAEVANAARVNA